MNSNSNGCNQAGCGSQRVGNGKVNCTGVGPFRAIDAACIPKENHSGGSHSGGCHPSWLPAPIPACHHCVCCPCVCPPWRCHQAGAVIAYASGDENFDLVSGTSKSVALIGFGDSKPLAINTSDINFDNVELNLAFSVPRKGSLTAICASFIVTGVDMLGDETVTINAKIYRALVGSNNFSPTTVSVDLVATVTSTTPVNTVLHGESLPFPPVAVAAGERLLMVFSISENIEDASVSGNASAGLNIV